MPIAEVLLLVSAVIVILVGHYVLRRVAAPSHSRRFLRWAFPSALIIPEALQHCTGYSIAVPLGPQVVFLTALAGYVLLMLLLWRTSRFVAGLGLGAIVVPVLYIFAHPLGFYFVGLVSLSDAITVPAVSGRISAVATYSIVEQESFIGGPSLFLEVYENPGWLPFVRREVRREPLPCGDKARPNDAWVHSGSNEYTVVVSCRNPGAGAPEQIVIR